LAERNVTKLGIGRKQGMLAIQLFTFLSHYEAPYWADMGKTKSQFNQSLQSTTQYFYTNIFMVRYKAEDWCSVIDHCIAILFLGQSSSCSGVLSSYQGINSLPIPAQPWTYNGI